MKKYRECIFTPVKGTYSCRYCPFSIVPEMYDPGCRVPQEIMDRAERGEITEAEVYDHLLPIASKN